MGPLVKVVGPYTPVFAIFHNGSSQDEADGVEVILLKELLSHLNFTVEYLWVESWGTLMPNGSWSEGGMMSAITDGDADLAIGLVIQNSALYQYMDFGPVFTTGKLEFAVRRPEQIEVQWQTVLKIFQPVVWLSVFATFILVVVINKKIIDIYSNSSTQRWQQSITTTLGFFLLTSSFTPDRTNRTRCLLTVWSVFCLLMTTFLSAGIFSKLTLPLYTDRVDTLQQLVEQGYYWTSEGFKRLNTSEALGDHVFNRQNVWARRYLSKYRSLNSKEVARLVPWDRKITFPLRIEGDDLIIFDEAEVFFGPDLRQFRMSKEPTMQDHISIGLRKQLPTLFVEAFAMMFQRFLEVGLIQYWKIDVLRRYPEFDTRHFLEEHDVPVFKGPEPLPLSKLRSLFYLLIIGYVAATCAFIVEYFLIMFYKAKAYSQTLSYMLYDIPF